MTEPEVSLKIAMHFIQSGKTLENVFVSIDGAHIKTKDTMHFEIIDYLQKNGYDKCDGRNDKWQGDYKNKNHSPRIIISSTPGEGDVVIHLSQGKTLYIESKKFKSGSGGEYPAMREAIGQLMTGCPEDNIPIVAVPFNGKSAELAKRWSRNSRICNAGIRFMLVHDDGTINFI